MRDIISHFPFYEIAHENNIMNIARRLLSDYRQQDIMDELVLNEIKHSNALGDNMGATVARTTLNTVSLM